MGRGERPLQRVGGWAFQPLELASPSLGGCKGFLSWGEAAREGKDALGMSSLSRKRALGQKAHGSRIPLSPNELWCGVPTRGKVLDCFHPPCSRNWEAEEGKM